MWIVPPRYTVLEPDFTSQTEVSAKTVPHNDANTQSENKLNPGMYTSMRFNMFILLFKRADTRPAQPR